MIIIGAGLAGCLAGALERNATIFESGPGISGQHRAVLRFREDAIGHAIGIPFKRVTVRKAIVVDGEFYQPTILHCNMYAKKVLGRLVDRSINDIAPVERYVAPVDLHGRLGEICRGRISFNVKVKSLDEIRTAERIPIISTIPMPMLLEMLGMKDGSTPEFSYAGISVSRWRIPDCDVHQTIYFPGAETPAYRATLTGEDLIIEGISPVSEEDEKYIANCFFIPLESGELVSRGSQRFGKINPLPDDQRKELLLKITMLHNVYSLGRFACWRNVLLDDVYQDFHKIRSMINLNHYDLIKAMT